MLKKSPASWKQQFLLSSSRNIPMVVRSRWWLAPSLGHSCRAGLSGGEGSCEGLSGGKSHAL